MRSRKKYLIGQKLEKGKLPIDQDYNLRLQQRSTKGLQSLYGFGELPGQPRSRDGRMEARPKPTFHLLHTTILQLEPLSGGCTARAGVRQSRSLRERAASSVATNRSTIGARAWSRYRRCCPDPAHPSPCSGCSVRDVSWVLLACSRNNYSAGIGMIPSR